LLIKIYLQEGEVDKAIESFTNLDEKDQEKPQAKTIKITLNLIQLAKKQDDERLQVAIQATINNPIQGIEQLLDLLATSKGEQREPIKQSLISAFDLIEDIKLVSQLRRKMASLIF